MKVFWSWQSDTPGNIGRHFVRDALAAAIESLRADPDLEEPKRDSLALDHDREGVPGSPDLARVILEKIEACAVFVGDVTLVGKTSEGDKKLINSNVAIELGYALRALSDRRLLMVMNAHYGEIGELPFDLRHKAGPVVFNLAPGADKAAIKSAQKDLRDRLAVRLKPYLLEKADEIEPEVPTFLPAEHGADRSIFSDEHHEILAHFGEYDDEETEFVFHAESVCYLRLYPVSRQAQPFGRAELYARVHSLQPLFGGRGALRSLNEYGVIVFHPAQPGSIIAATQVFESGELWGFTSLSFTEFEGKRLVATLAFEKGFFESLRHYIQFAVSELGLSFPINVELGAHGLKGVRLGMTVRYSNELWGPIRVDEIYHQARLSSADDELVNGCLLDFFGKVFDQTGHVRPTGLYGFPPGPPRAPGPRLPTSNDNF